MSDTLHHPKVAPRNLTARAAYRVVGNPANTRLESSVGNCFPGLEMDVRDLDRRFFPGLVFNAVRIPLSPAPEAPHLTQGFHLVFVDYMYDPMLPAESDAEWVQTLLAGYRGPVGTALAEGRWFLDWIEQAGTKISFYDDKGAPFDGMLVWRFIRSLEAGDAMPVRIGLVRRGHDGKIDADPITLEGYRRQYRAEDGVFDASYQAGELTQSLCNPWSHDFRDCGCHYWPSNHPDVVMAEVDEENDALPTGQSKDPLAAETYLDWLRADRSAAGLAASANTVEANRPFQIDHYEVNQMWSKLPIVVEGRETGEVYHAAPDQEHVTPYGTPQDMINDLRGRLAPLEMVLAMQYLYAYFSLADPDQVDQDRWPTLKDDLIFARRAILGVAIGEMTHLRWANQMLWELQGPETYDPILIPAKTLRYGPGKGHDYPRALQPLTPKAINQFIQIERPGGYIDRAYAKCVATLKDRAVHSEHLYALAVRIDTDGDEHYLKFKQMKEILAKYDDVQGAPAYQRPLTPAADGQADVAVGMFRAIIDGLHAAYLAEAHDDFAAAQEAIGAVRHQMETFRAEGEALAAKGIGIPFWPAGAA